MRVAEKIRCMEVPEAKLHAMTQKRELDRKMERLHLYLSIHPTDESALKKANDLQENIDYLAGHIENLERIEPLILKRRQEDEDHGC